METKFIEAVSDAGNYGKFMVARFTVMEWARRSQVEEIDASLLASVGWTGYHILVVDLQTGEGAIFAPGGYAHADLEKHAVWVCPLFEPFLEWLYTQSLDLLDALPDKIELTGIPLQLAGYRRPGPQH